MPANAELSVSPSRLFNLTSYFAYTGTLGLVSVYFPQHILRDDDEELENTSKVMTQSCSRAAVVIRKPVTSALCVYICFK